MRALFQMMQAVSTTDLSNLRASSVLLRLFVVSAEILRTESITLFEVSQSEEDCLVATHALDKEVIGSRVKLGQGIAGWAAEHSSFVNVADAYEDPRFNRQVDLRTGVRTRAVLCTPVICDGKVVAIVQAIKKSTGAAPTGAETAVGGFLSAPEDVEMDDSSTGTALASAPRVTRSRMLSSRDTGRLPSEASSEPAVVQVQAFDQADLEVPLPSRPPATERTIVFICGRTRTITQLAMRRCDLRPSCGNHDPHSASRYRATPPPRC